jgi:hypothetical protein
MPGTADPHLSELSYHIVILWDFWKRSTANPLKSAGVRAIRSMIQASFGDYGSDKVARLVMMELKGIESDTIDEERAIDAKIAVVAELLGRQKSRFG